MARDLGAESFPASSFPPQPINDETLVRALRAPSGASSLPRPTPTLQGLLGVREVRFGAGVRAPEGSATRPDSRLIPGRLPEAEVAREAAAGYAPEGPSVRAAPGV